MKGVILCAGLGLRLRPLAEDLPKCLLAFGGRTILERTLDDLGSAGIDEVVLVTGHREEMIRSFIRLKGYRGVSFVRNPRYAETNTAYSLRLALETLDTDVFLANGDVLFDREILLDLLGHAGPDCVAVDAGSPLDAEEVKVIASDGFVERIGKRLAPEACLGEAIGLCKIGRATATRLRGIYAELESRDELHHFFEMGFDRLSTSPKGPKFGIILTRGRPWIEIDTIEDYRNAERSVYPRLGR